MHNFLHFLHLSSPLFHAGKAAFSQVSLSGQALFDRVKGNKSVLYFSLLFFFPQPLSFCGCVGQGTWAAMCNEGSVMKMESRDNHTLGHVKTQLQPECSECAWLLAISRVKYPHYFRDPSVYPASISIRALVFMSMLKCFIDIPHALYIHSHRLYWLPPPGTMMCLTGNTNICSWWI